VCPTLLVPANGGIRCGLGQDRVPTPEDVCRFSCDDGFTLEGRRTCTTQNGVANWNGRDDTVCVRGMITHNLI